MRFSILQKEKTIVILWPTHIVFSTLEVKILKELIKENLEVDKSKIWELLPEEIKLGKSNNNINEINLDSDNSFESEVYEEYIHLKDQIMIRKKNRKIEISDLLPIDNIEDFIYALSQKGKLLIL